MDIRKNVNDPAAKEDLKWYSKAVIEMKTRDISDPSSWWYQGGIHGYSTDPFASQFWKEATGYPPSPELANSAFWQRCQHGTWYFLPWHRLYLYYFEEIVAQTIVDIGGPSGWRLPFWNYCEAVNPSATNEERKHALNIPAAFGSATGPASETPGLWIKDRSNYTLPYAQYTNPMPALKTKEFTGITQLGGGITGFNHRASGDTGQLENIPHNAVHGMIGGAMGDPDTAALDPIFWLHHANIDRLWQVWLDYGNGRNNPTDKNWSQFVFNFHDAAKQPVKAPVKASETTHMMGYEYQDAFPAGVVIDTTATLATPVNPTMDVIGASLQDTNVQTGGSSTKLEMIPAKHRSELSHTPRIMSFATAETAGAIALKSNQTTLHIANVTGTGTAPIVDVYLNEKLAGSVGLFGLKQASTKDLRHDGSGMNFSLDITDTLKELQDEGNWDEDNIVVNLIPQGALKEGTSINFGRVSLMQEI